MIRSFEIPRLQRSVIPRGEKAGSELGKQQESLLLWTRQLIPWNISVPGVEIAEHSLSAVTWEPEPPSWLSPSWWDRGLLLQDPRTMFTK